jgi:hypothetical protein
VANGKARALQDERSSGPGIDRGMLFDDRTSTLGALPEPKSSSRTKQKSHVVAGTKRAIRLGDE